LLCDMCDESSAVIKEDKKLLPDKKSRHLHVINHVLICIFSRPINNVRREQKQR